jgi:ABC-type Mn2+/Zn2+ transport system ATPase subunit
MTVQSNEKKVNETKEPIICMKDIAVAYQSNVAIFDINLDIYKNDFVGICGPNGSGKSTLLKTMVGALKPFRGEVKIFSQKVNSQHANTAIKARIGYLPQMDGIDRNFPALVKDVVGMGLYSRVGLFRRLNNKDNERRIMEALRFVELEEFANRPIGHLSGGQQQKVMIARGIVNKPAILFLDEPTSSLDFKVSKNIMGLIQKINEETDLTIVMVSHDIEFIKKYCTRVFCIDRRITWKGDPKKEFFDEVINHVFRR